MRRTRFAVSISLSALGLSCANSQTLLHPSDNDAGASSDGAIGDVGGKVGAGCSSDLHTVLDANGGAIFTCPDDQGCADGACAPACDAAAASHGSLGCDFMVSTPPATPELLPPCFAIFLANGWSKPAHATAVRDGSPLNVGKFGRTPTAGADPQAWPPVSNAGIDPGQVAVLFMSSDPASVESQTGTVLACPVPDAIPAPTAVAASGRGKAFHIQTDFPVNAYALLPFGGARSFLPGATLLYPTTAWGSNYVVSMPPVGDHPRHNWLHVVAAQDDTTVTILPTEILPGGDGVDQGPDGEVSSYKVGAGEYIQFGGANELAGSVISSDKPIALSAGNTALTLFTKTAPTGAADGTMPQLMPVSAFGTEYVAAPYATRSADLTEESIAYQVVGAADGTVLTFDPPVAEGPATLKTAQVVTFDATGAFRVTSQDPQHPFYLGQFMAGGLPVGYHPRAGATVHFAGIEDGFGDPEHVNVLPVAQFLSKYAFYTDVTYGTTNLVLTRVKTADGFRDVTIDCVGVVGGWTPVGTGGQYETTNVDLVRAGVPVGSCDNGGHTAQSDGPFGLVVWGLDTWSSYGYPAGGNAAALNEVVIPPVPR